MSDFSIRPPTLDELPHIVNLAWRCYDHIKDEILDDINLFAKKIQDNLIRSLVVISNTSDELVGHGCLKYLETDSNVPEMGVVFVDPAYQGNGIAKRLCQDLYDIAKANGADGVFDGSVTTHPYTQRVIQTSTDARPCCVIFKIATPNLQAKEIEITPQAKGSVVNHYMAFNHTQATVYCPQQHAQIVQEIYDWHGLSRTFCKAETALATGPSAVFTIPLPTELDATFIMVSQVGTDTQNDLSNAIQAAKRSGIGAVFTFLPLENAHTPDLVQCAESLSLSFAGIMPHIHNGGDRIILQWIATPIDFDTIQIYGTHGQRLFDYVKTEIRR